MLRNKNSVLEIKGKKLALVGLDDSWVCRSNYSKATEGIPEDFTIRKIIMAHEPTGAPNSFDGKHDLILSGHTHCGQVRIPFVTEYALSRFGFGDFAGGRRAISNEDAGYGTCGLTPGFVRLNAPPEISVIEIS